MRRSGGLCGTECHSGSSLNVAKNATDARLAKLSSAMRVYASLHPQYQMQMLRVVREIALSASERERDR